MYLLDRSSSPWWLNGVVLSDMVKTAFAPFFSARRERTGKIALAPLSDGWLREHDLESAKRGAE